MPNVQFTRHLETHFPGLTSVDVEGGSLAEVVRALDEHRPGLAAYVVDDQGALRKHVVIFVNGQLLTDRLGLRDPVGPGDQVFIMQALSGG